MLTAVVLTVAAPTAAQDRALVTADDKAAMSRLVDEFLAVYDPQNRSKESELDITRRMFDNGPDFSWVVDASHLPTFASRLEQIERRFSRPATGTDETGAHVTLDERMAAMRAGAMESVVRGFVPAESVEEQWDLPGLQRVLKDEWQLEVDLVSALETSESPTDEDVLEKVQAEADRVFNGKLEIVGREQFTPFMKMVLLQSIDSHWREHLAALDYLRQGIHLRGYAQKNPKQEYKREAFELFSQLLDVVKMEVTRLLLTVRIQSQEQAVQAAEAIEEHAGHVANVTYTHPNEDGSVSQEADPATVAVQVPRVGRNDPCPCGSGQKYKNCHGKLA